MSFRRSFLAISAALLLVSPFAYAANSLTSSTEEIQAPPAADCPSELEGGNSQTKLKKAEADALIIWALEFVRPTAFGVLKSSHGRDFDDLIAIGNLQIIELVYDGTITKSTKPAFIKNNLRWKMISELRKLTAIPKLYFFRIKRLKRTIKILEAKLMRSPTRDELASELHWTRSDLSDVIAAENAYWFKNSRPSYIDQEQLQRADDESNDESNATNVENERDTTDFVEELINEDGKQRIRQAITTLPRRQREIVLMIMDDHLSYSEIMDQFRRRHQYEEVYDERGKKVTRLAGRAGKNKISKGMIAKEVDRARDRLRAAVR